jgi:membrane-bound lytic murein transglycosylase D
MKSIHFLCAPLWLAATLAAFATFAQEGGQRITFPPLQDPMAVPAVALPAVAAPTVAAPMAETPSLPLAVDASPKVITSVIQVPNPNPPAAKATARFTTIYATEPNGDLWARIRRGFAMPDLQTDLVKNREQWYSTRPDYITRMTERSSKYLHHIVQELEIRKMPTELALLPFIESAFNPQAVSTAKAAGMWQFIPSTGKFYSLKQNAFRDDRRDVQASTRAALDYLQKLYGMFGDWHLALAAYNWGEGSVGRAIAKNQKSGKNTGYLDLKMPSETQYYVPKLQAVKNIVANPSLFSTTLPSIEDHPYFTSVPITRDMDVALAAKFADVPVGDFKALNPSLSRPVILAAGTPQVLMPWRNAEAFNSNLNSYTGQLASWTAWVAPSNLKPADAAKRVGMSETQLREINSIPVKAGMIKAGSTLLIPRHATKQEDVTAHVADNGQLTMNAPAARSNKARKTVKAVRSTQVNKKATVNKSKPAPKKRR